jgi:hypothetical protein
MKARTIVISDYFDNEESASIRVRFYEKPITLNRLQPTWAIKILLY